MSTIGLDNRFKQIDDTYKTVDRTRAVISTVGKAGIVGVGALAARSIKKNDKSLVKDVFSKGVDLGAKAIQKGAKFVDKKDKTGISALMNKVKSAPAGTKALVAVAVATGLAFLNNIRKNNRAKGVIAQAKNDTKALVATTSFYEDKVLPREIKRAERKTAQDIAFSEQYKTTLDAVNKHFEK